MKTTVIIPARYGSTRFPGKALARDPQGRPLIQHVWQAAGRARGVDQVIVATDDDRIASAVRGFGGEARMTAARHASGSDRCAEIANDLDSDVVVNLQGDEPAILPEMVAQAIDQLLEDPESVIGTLACRIADDAELSDPNCVKVVVDDRWRALYFSRAPIPHVRGSQAPARESAVPHLLHVGIYAFRRKFLLDFARFGPHPLEETEKLEQLRALAHGYIIKVALTPHRTFKVDTPQDFEVFCASLRPG